MKFLVPLMLLTTFLLCGCQTNEESAYSEKELSTAPIHYAPAAPDYTIDAIYSEDSHTLTADMKVAFKNASEEDMHDVYFNLWPNAEDFEEGSIEVKDVFSHGDKLDVSVDGTTMKVSGFTLPDEQSMELAMNFTVHIPEMKNRFGWSGEQVSLGNWFPILAVHDSHGWNMHPYFPHGEAFYSITGNYDVTIDVPGELDVIATGEANSISSGNRTRHRFTAENVRDFALVLNRDLHVAKQDVNGTEIAVHYPATEEAEAKIMLEAAIDAIETFEDSFTDYPWATLDVVSVDYSRNFDGGMEYPQLVTINTPHMEDDEELALTVVHEVAHQWFYSLVGNDPYREPWLDESLATFASYAAFYETTDFDWIGNTGSDYTITSSVADFADEDIEQYGDLMYDGGALMLSKLYDQIGEEAFFQGLRDYTVEMKFGIATTADFIRIMEDASGENLKPFFESHGVNLEETKN